MTTTSSDWLPRPTLWLVVCILAFFWCMGLPFFRALCIIYNLALTDYGEASPWTEITRACLASQATQAPHTFPNTTAGCGIWLDLPFTTIAGKGETQIGASSLGKCVEWWTSTRHGSLAVSAVQRTLQSLGRVLCNVREPLVLQAVRRTVAKSTESTQVTGPIYTISQATTTRTWQRRPSQGQGRASEGRQGPTTRACHHCYVLEGAYTGRSSSATQGCGSVCTQECLGTGGLLDNSCRKAAGCTGQGPAQLEGANPSGGPTDAGSASADADPARSQVDASGGFPAIDGEERDREDQDGARSLPPTLVPVHTGACGSTSTADGGTGSRSHHLRRQGGPMARSSGQSQHGTPAAHQARGAAGNLGHRGGYGGRRGTSGQGDRGGAARGAATRSAETAEPAGQSDAGASAEQAQTRADEATREGSRTPRRQSSQAAEPGAEAKDEKAEAKAAAVPGKAR